MKQRGVGVQGQEWVEVHFFSLLHPFRLPVVPAHVYDFFYLVVPHCVSWEKERKNPKQWPVKTGGPGGAEVLQTFPSWCLTLPGASRTYEAQL